MTTDQRHRRLLSIAFTAALALSSLVAAASPARAAPAPVSLAGANWIWYPEGDPRASAPAEVRYFRKTFTIADGAATDAQLVLAADDTADVWLNGVPLGASPRVANSWTRALYIDLGGAVRAGTDVLAIAVRNTTVSPAGLLARLKVVTAGGTTELVSDASWKSTTAVTAGWEQPGSSDSSWPAAKNLGAFGVAPWGSGIAAPDLNAASPLALVGATTERRTNPLGVDTPKPRFGWKLTGDSTVRQGAYQIIVASTAAMAADGVGDIWDSGRIAGSRSIDVEYGGRALTSLARYHWRVRVWDSQGRASGWGATQTFETGLFNPATEWMADFIGRSGAGPDLAGASWIWYPEGDPLTGVPAATRYFRRTITLGSTPRQATLVVTGDDTADVWVNGVAVSSSPRVSNSWTTAAVVDLGGRLSAGINVIAIATENTSQSPAGMVAKLAVDGGPTITTDADWRSAQSAPSGWQQVGFNDTSWPAARALTAYGSGPWGSNVSIHAPSPLLRKSFTVGKPVARARLLTTALGLHETRLNGSRVGADVLAPGWTDYNDRVQYRVSDVTGAIRQGDNTIGAQLGYGWFAGSLGFAGSQHYGDQPYYSAVLRIDHTDGTTTTVKTDASWRTTSGPIRYDDLYGGEEYDARMALTGWDSPGFDDGTWAAATVRGAAKPRLVSQVDNGVVVHQELRPVAVTQPKPGVHVLDLGQNQSGVARLRVRGPAGTTVTMRFAEVLNPDGTLYTANLRSARVTDRYTLAGTGADEVYTPRFTVHGYRYVELTGYPGTPTADSVTGLAMWTDAPQIGTFETSNALINQLQHNIVWGQRSNMLSVPTDCPQRDERLGWTGDLEIFAGTSTFNFDAQAFLSKFSTDLADAQRGDGSFTDVAPDVCCGSGTAGWGDAGVVVPYTVWQRYGDLRPADQNFNAMARWVDYLRGTANPDLIRDRPTYGDWLNVNDNTTQDVVSTAFFAWSARLVSRMAAATGRSAQATSYGQLADQVSAAFTARFVSGNGVVSGNTQTGYVLALAFDLLPPNLRQPAADRLAEKVAARGGHLSVGFLGVENLLPVLARYGHLDTAYQILLQPEYPGWGYLNSRGATTIWERWDGIRTDGSFNDPGMNSFNHYGLGSVGDWLYRSVGGLGPAAPGYERLSIAPRPGGGLTSGRAALQTPYGQAVSDWSVSNGTLTLRVTVPANATAIVAVPAPSAAAVTAPPQAVPLGYRDGAAQFHLPAGSYVFTA